MIYNPDIYHRRSIRLKGYDYSNAGFYYVTICTQNRLHLLGKITDGEMILNDAGKMIEHQWQQLNCRFENIELHEFVIMPNHFHGIIEFVRVPLVGTQNIMDTQNTVRVPLVGTQNKRQPQRNTGQPQGFAPTLGDVIGAFKSLTTNDYIRNVTHNNWPRFNKKIWQRNYYEHIIRDEKSFYKISEYIRTNPLLWQDDKYYD